MASKAMPKSTRPTPAPVCGPATSSDLTPARPAAHLAFKGSDRASSDKERFVGDRMGRPPLWSLTLDHQQARRALRTGSSGGFLTLSYLGTAARAPGRRSKCPRRRTDGTDCRFPCVAPRHKLPHNAASTTRTTATRAAPINPIVGQLPRKIPRKIAIAQLTIAVGINKGPTCTAMGVLLRVCTRERRGVDGKCNATKLPGVSSRYGCMLQVLERGYG